MTDLLLLHGALGTSETFNEISELLKSHFYVHKLTLPGHGQRFGETSELSMNVFVDDIIRQLDAHKLNQVQVFGYSMGGYAALYTAIRYPERISKIMTLATVFDWSPERALKEAALLNPEKIQLKVPAFADQLIKLHGKENWKYVMMHTAELMKNLGESHLTADDFSRLKCPVRISVGDRDQMVGLENSYAVSKLIPGASFLVIPETPHPFEKVNTERLAYEIRSFMIP